MVTDFSDLRRISEDELAPLHALRSDLEEATRQAVYAAEVDWEMSLGLDPLRPDEAQHYLDTVLKAAGRDWEDGPRIEWFAAEDDEFAGRYEHARWPERPVIRLHPVHGLRRKTVVHEAAHWMVGPRGDHGRRFRLAYIELSESAFGQAPARALAAAFERAGVPVPPRPRLAKSEFHSLTEWLP